MTNKKEIIIVLIAILTFSAIYYDQKFEPENIEILRESANARAQQLHSGQADILPTKAFTTDGCSLWLNSLFNNDFTDICIEHDIKYWKGGSTEDRKVADTTLRKSVNSKMPFMGDIMYAGVRIFGHPLIPSPWRWGYGLDDTYTY
ncbi:hypothetical protein CL630_01590 [bacterium]|nr:hypothetical protein [bacterium]